MLTIIKLQIKPISYHKMFSAISSLPIKLNFMLNSIVWINLNTIGMSLSFVDFLLFLFIYNI